MTNGRGPQRDELDRHGGSRAEWFDALYENHHRHAFGLAFSFLSDAHDAEDVVQEAFLGVWRSGQTPDPAQGSTRSWLLTVVRNRAIDVIRARRRHAALSFDERFDPPDGADVSAEAATAVDQQTARRELAHLPPEQRQVMELAYFAGMTHTEIAARLGLPVGTVKGRIRLALDRLRGIFTAREDSPKTA
jgi:RNA polymerase sigma-70 factor (ECF subfamily)